MTNYLIERCDGAGCSNFAQIGTSATTTFSNTGLTASTSYSYRVRATDAANNLSGYSNIASATTSAAPDTQAPTAPSGFGATAASSTQINLSWTASTDNVGVTNYLIERCQGAGCSNFAQIATSARHDVQQHGSHCFDRLRYPRTRNRRRQQSERLFQHRERDDHRRSRIRRRRLRRAA